jgi:hypothetical protein
MILMSRRDKEREELDRTEAVQQQWHARTILRIVFYPLEKEEEKKLKRNEYLGQQAQAPAEAAPQRIIRTETENHTGVH